MTQKAPLSDDLLNPAERYPEIAEAVQWLLAHDMARLDERSKAYYRATPLGQAVCASGLEPQQGSLGRFEDGDSYLFCIVCFFSGP